MNFWLIFLFAPNYLGSRTISTLRSRKWKVERERSVKNWGKYTFTSCAFARRCDPGALYAIILSTDHDSESKVIHHSVRLSFLTSNLPTWVPCYVLHWPTKVLIDHSFLI